MMQKQALPNASMGEEQRIEKVQKGKLTKITRKKAQKFAQ